MRNLIVSLRFTAVLFVLCCVIYPAAVWTMSRAFPAKAEGSLVRAADGTVMGSLLIGQSFSSPRYLHGRPSAVSYNASGSGGSNLGPSNPTLFLRIADAVTSASVLDGVTTASVANDRIYASGSGLDPHIMQENATQQANRIAQTRGIPRSNVDAIIRNCTTGGFIGPTAVNVLKVNLALDAEPSTAVKRPE